MLYLWLKTLHIVFIASWFAGLFYLPRIFVNMAAETDANVHARLLGFGILVVDSVFLGFRRVGSCQVNFGRGGLRVPLVLPSVD